MHLLLTAFEPFDGERVNPSEACVQALGGEQLQDVRLSTEVLPVHRERAPVRLIELLRALRPDVLIMLGEAGGRSHISVERVAINVDDFRIPDHGGAQPRDQAIDPAGPAAYLATLPVRALVDAMNARDIPAQVSNSAGTYLCNHVFYRALHALTCEGRSIPAGFVHLPYLSGQAAARGQHPSLPLGMMTDALRTCIMLCRARHAAAQQEIAQR
jgi:pyroglutamyl-peptidase